MTFFFYDLETSGVNPRSSRVMQFAGQRTDMDLKPIDEPVNLLIKMTEDTLPDPYAILVTGITPQKTIAEGITEAEFIKAFDKKINKPDTIFVGFNSIRFDDEFMRFLFWRNFHDSYEWHWQDGCSRWDILDVTRMTRALRPNGIKWPVDSKGQPTNRLELLSSVNKLDHTNAHDALSDVNATIAVAKLIKSKQPKLFDYLLSMRGKRKVQDFVDSNKIFVYSSGKYASEFEKTAVVASVCPHPDKNGVLVYDLRYDPTTYIKMSPEELADKWQWKKDSGEPRLPVKSLQHNRCPAIAPISVLDEPSKKRLQIDMAKIDTNHKIIQTNRDNFSQNLLKALEILNKDRVQLDMVVSDIDVDNRLYDGFIDDKDKNLSSKLRSSSPGELSEFAGKFKDERLKTLLPLYKARNFPKHLNEEEHNAWEAHRKNVLLSAGEKSVFAEFNKSLAQLSKDKPSLLSDDKRYLLEELSLYAESILPEL